MSGWHTPEPRRLSVRVTVRCAFCEHEYDVQPGTEDVAMCPKCSSPCAVVKAAHLA